MTVREIINQAANRAWAATARRRGPVIKAKRNQPTRPPIDRHQDSGIDYLQPGGATRLRRGAKSSTSSKYNTQEK